MMAKKSASAVQEDRLSLDPDLMDLQSGGPDSQSGGLPAQSGGLPAQSGGLPAQSDKSTHDVADGLSHEMGISPLGVIARDLVAENQVTNCVVHIPVIPLPEGDVAYRSRHIHMQLIPEHANALWAVRNGLHERHLKTNDGNHVDHVNDAIRWILENVASVMEGVNRETSGV
jgi:hypothetical protein